MISLNIVYFAWVRDRLGKSEEQAIISDAVKSISDLVAQLAERDVTYRDVFSDLTKLRFALDQDFVSIDTPIGESKELAIFPPVTGG